MLHPPCNSQRCLLASKAICTCCSTGSGNDKERPTCSWDVVFNLACHSESTSAPCTSQVTWQPTMMSDAPLFILSHEPGRFFSFSIQTGPPSAANPLHPTMLQQPCLENRFMCTLFRPIAKPPQLAVPVARPDPCYPNPRRNIVHSSLNTPMRYAHGRALDKALITRNCLSP